MNAKTITIAAVAAIIGICACSNDGVINNVPENGKSTAVSLAITEESQSAESQSTSRMASNNVPIGTLVVFRNGYAIFTNNANVIVKVTEIVQGKYVHGNNKDDDAKYNTGSKVWLEDMKNINKGGMINNVPGSASKVYIAANLPAGVRVPSIPETIDQFKKRAITLGSQSSTSGNVDNVTLYGDGAALVDHPQKAGTKYAKVIVRAIASRLELGRISYKSATNFIKEFRIEGIFINHYFPEMGLAHLTAAPLVKNIPTSNSEANNMFIPNSPAYPLTMSTISYDYKLTGLGVDAGNAISWSPDKENALVWAYNTLAPTTTKGGLETEIQTPHLVIRLSGIITVEDRGSYYVYPGTQYLTVRRFRDKGTSEVITHFEPGKVYYLENLEFDESNLTEIPEAESMVAYVEAQLTSWRPVRVDYDY